MTDLICKACGAKLYDSKTNLRYWYTYVDTDEVKPPRTQFGCIHCGHKYSLAEKREWSVAAQSASVDVPAFDAQANKRKLCPPTVFRRFKARLDELQAKDRQVRDAQELLNEIWDDWKAEQ